MATTPQVHFERRSREGVLLWRTSTTLTPLLRVSRLMAALEPEPGSVLPVLDPFDEAPFAEALRLVEQAWRLVAPTDSLDDITIAPEGVGDATLSPAAREVWAWLHADLGSIDTIWRTLAHNDVGPYLAAVRAGSLSLDMALVLLSSLRTIEGGSLIAWRFLGAGPVFPSESVPSPSTSAAQAAAINSGDGGGTDARSPSVAVEEKRSRISADTSLASADEGAAACPSELEVPPGGAAGGSGAGGGGGGRGGGGGSPVASPPALSLGDVSEAEALKEVSELLRARIRDVLQHEPSTTTEAARLRLVRRLHFTERVLGGQDRTPFAFAAHPSLPHIATAAHDGMIRVWDVETGRRTRVLVADSEPQLALAFSPDGTRVAAADKFTVRVWDGAAGSPQWIFRGDFSEACALAWRSAGPSFLAVGSSNGCVQVWSASSGSRVRTLCDMVEHATHQCLAAHPSRDWLVSACNELVRVWDWETGVLVREFRGGAGMTCSLAATSEFLVTALQDGRVVVGRWDDERVDVELGRHPCALALNALAVSADGARLASHDVAGRVIVWDLATRARVTLFEASASWGVGWVGSSRLCFEPKKSANELLVVHVGR